MLGVDIISSTEARAAGVAIGKAAKRNACTAKGHAQVAMKVAVTMTTVVATIVLALTAIAV